MKSKVDSKVCGVCGDKALGYNFNAVTCESCKAFFRRNALVQKEFKCPFSDQCEITTITRRFCQKCRLDKCFAIGMCKDLIMSEEDKVLKRQKIEENRAKKRSNSTSNSFKHSFKKIKRETSEADSQESFSSCIFSEENTSTSTTTPENFKLNLNQQQLSSDGACNNNNNRTLVGTTNLSSTTEDNFQQNIININNSNSNSNSASNIVSVINYNSVKDDLNSLSPTERLVSSSSDDVSVSMIRNMLNHNTPPSSVLTPRNSLDDRTGFGNGNNSNNNNILPTTNLLTTLINNENHCVNNFDDTKQGLESLHQQPNSSSSTTAAATSSTFRKTLDVTKDVVADVHRVSIEPNSIESILCEAIKLEFEAYSSIPQCHSNSRELNDAERAKLNELIVANKALLTPLDDELNHLIGDRGNARQTLEADPALVDVINLTASVIRRLIKMAKKINAFKNMCQEDQVALLKGGCTEIMILRSAMNYDPTKQTWKIPHSQETFNLNVDILKLAKGNVYQEHERFIKTFDPRWRSDENIVLILCAITLFTPDRPRVIHQDVIKLEQNSYYYLLRRYLESIYPGCEAKSTFLKLIQKIQELHKFNEELINVYLDVNPSQVEPLLIEIFDLKH